MPEPPARGLAAAGQPAEAGHDGHEDGERRQEAQEHHHILDNLGPIEDLYVHFASPS